MGYLSEREAPSRGCLHKPLPPDSAHLTDATLPEMMRQKMCRMVATIFGRADIKEHSCGLPAATKGKPKTDLTIYLQSPFNAQTWP
jgi:hypothetical protein